MTTPSMRLLLVDDNEVNLDVLGRRLERKGCHVTCVLDGPSALEAIARDGYDAIILDLQMPGMTGIDVLQQIRQSYSQVALPVIMATALSDPETMVSALEAGANDYVTKPIDVDVLFARLRAQLRSAEAAREPKAPTTSPLAASVDPRAPVQIGSVVGQKYRLEAVLGTGGFGSVYRARHLTLDTEVAVKVLHPHLAGATNVRKRFEQEGVSAVRVKHPNAVTVHDAGTTEQGLPFLVMELLAGVTLGQELDGAGMLRLARAVEVMAPVCEVLEEAHRVGIVHRDVKPANIMLAESPRGQVIKVLDFGISKFIDREKQLGLTGDGVAGTPLFMSPEALLGRPTGPETDVFSVGVTLFLSLAGEPPHGPPAKSPFEQAIRQVPSPPTPLGAVRPDLPSAVTQMIMATLARDPQNRPKLAELRETLVEWAGRFSEPSWPPTMRAETTSHRPRALADDPTAIAGQADSGITQSMQDSGEVGPPKSTSRNGHG